MWEHVGPEPFWDGDTTLGSQAVSWTPTRRRGIDELVSVTAGGFQIASCRLAEERFDKFQ